MKPRIGSKEGRFFTVNTSIDHALARLIAQHPRFAPSLTPTSAVLSDVSWAELTLKAIAAGKQQFFLDNDKHAAQLWLYTLLGDVVAPSMVLMVQEGIFADLSVAGASGFDGARESGGNGHFFQRDDAGFWFGFAPSNQVESAFEVGESLGTFLPDLIEDIAACAKMRSAPLWAVAVDGFIQPLMGAGNEELETAAALAYAQSVWEGLAHSTGVALPRPRFAQVVDEQVADISPEAIAGGQVAEDEEPEFIFSHRVSCCMIYHSPKAGLCTSCPHQDKQQRLAGIISAAAGF